MTLSGIFPLFSSCKAFSVRFSLLSKAWRYYWVVLDQKAIHSAVRILIHRFQGIRTTLSILCASDVEFKSDAEISRTSYQQSFFQFILKHLVVFVVKSNWGWFLLFFVSRRNRWSSLQRTALPFLRFFHQYRNFFLKQTILSCLFNITQRLFNLEDINLSFVNREIWLFSSIFSCFTDIRRVADLRPPYSIQK